MVCVGYCPAQQKKYDIYTGSLQDYSCRTTDGCPVRGSNQDPSSCPDATSGGFQKKGESLCGVPMIRILILVFWALYEGPPVD